MNVDVDFSAMDVRIAAPLPQRFRWVPFELDPPEMTCEWCGHRTSRDEIYHCPRRPEQFPEAMRAWEV